MRERNYLNVYILLCMHSTKNIAFGSNFRWVYTFSPLSKKLIFNGRSVCVSVYLTVYVSACVFDCVCVCMCLCVHVYACICYHLLCLHYCSYLAVTNLSNVYVVCTCFLSCKGCSVVLLYLYFVLMFVTT